MGSQSTGLSFMSTESTLNPRTLKDIAREAGVSVATVDRVLHGRAGVRADTARRVREAVARYDSRPCGTPSRSWRGPRG